MKNGQQTQPSAHKVGFFFTQLHFSFLLTNGSGVPCPPHGPKYHIKTEHKVFTQVIDPKVELLQRHKAQVVIFAPVRQSLLGRASLVGYVVRLPSTHSANSFKTQQAQRKNGKMPGGYRKDARERTVR